MDCNCPAPATLTDIDNQDCGVDLTQIQRLAFQRHGFGFDSAAATPTDILLLADWQAKKAAVDSEKIVITPLIGGDPVIAPGEAITNGGGDNSTLNGKEEVEGVNPSTFTANFKSLSPAIEKQMKALMCEPYLTVYLFLQGGRIASKLLTADTAYEGFACESVFISDRGNEGFGTKDTFSFRFSLPSGWSEDLAIVKPNFNPLTEL